MLQNFKVLFVILLNLSIKKTLKYDSGWAVDDFFLCRYSSITLLLKGESTFLMYKKICGYYKKTVFAGKKRENVVKSIEMEKKYNLKVSRIESTQH